MPKRPLAFPSAYTVLLVVVVLAAVATWVLPAGKYSQLAYDETRQAFVITSPEGEVVRPATQATLDSLRVAVPLQRFTDGGFRRPIAVPGTYRRVEGDPQGAVDVAKAPGAGFHEAADVILFILVIGGFVGVFNRSGALTAGVTALAMRLRGREGVLVVLVTALTALGGTTFGMGEETLAFYPVLVPIFLAAGYDAVVPMAALFLGSNMGVMASTTNPFATIIASDAAGITWTSGLWGRLAMLTVGTAITVWYILRYGRRVQREPARSLLRPPGAADEVPPAAAAAADAAPARMTGRIRLLLVLFALTFVVMVVGVARLGWWFSEMTALFLVAAIVLGIVSGAGEKEVAQSFVEGARDLLGVALIVGLARAATVMLSQGMVSDTLVHAGASAVQGMPGPVFIVGLLLFFVVFTLFIGSSSGMAVLTMPIVAPLAEVVGVPREQIVNAYLYGMGVMSMISPVGLVLPSLAMIRMGYGAWLRFVLPLMGILAGVSVLFLVAGVLAG